MEALGSGMNAVSTQTGATGIDPLISNGKLLIVNENDNESFTHAIIQSAGNNTQTPAVFFEHFYWGNITKQAAVFIQDK